MRHFFSIIAASAFLWSCGGNPNPSTEGGVGATTATATNTTVTAATTTFSNTVKGKPTKIKGSIQGATEGLRVFLDKKTASTNDIVTSANVATDGSFELNVGIEEPALYRLRVDVSPVVLLLKGDENINIQASLAGGKMTDYSIEGSPESQELAELSRKNPKEIAEYLKTAPAEKALSNYALVEKLNITNYLDLYKKVSEQLNAQTPASPYATPFKVFVMQEDLRINAPSVEIGAQAPDIKMSSPDGKEYSLSSLKGKVVLVDFWASWCGPCRKENPNVVRTYNKYKEKGFEVFSVSLDGLDDAAMTRMGTPGQLNQAMENERNKWKDAIAKDGLIWKHHVSDLRRWSSQAAALYKVNSIPLTYLLDRQGKIRFTNLRGAELETRLKELL